ncbi:hypothetical protein ACFVJW_06175 [Streptomyces libani]|uniref:hypothetical protein n=1 Tax=Streptomyces nigrescens TaxID=1920 RepID=UPI00362E7795
MATPTTPASKTPAPTTPGPATAAPHPAAPPPTAGRGAQDLLRTVLRIDSWGTAAFGVVLLAGGSALSGPLGLPTTWSVPFGIAMLGGAAALALIAGYPRIPARLTQTVIAANTLSCLALLLLPFTNALPLTTPGTAFLLIGAVVVAVFAALEYRGYCRGGGRGSRSARATTAPPAPSG